MAFIIINVLSEMDFAYLNLTQSQRIHHSKVSGWKVNFPDVFCGHIEFMQIMRVVQSCQLSNKAEFVLGPH